jgi:alpha-1,3-rhamnosyl/mannosyltransferase
LSHEEIDPVLQKYRLGFKNYFLFVSRVEIKKNPEILISAFGELKKKMGFGDPLRLVFAGRPGFGFEKIKKVFENSSAKEFISFLGYIPSEDLPAFVSGSLALLVPSWYEGFGIPALEAASCGTPVIASDIPPAREVLGGAAIFVSPKDTESWEQAMERIAKDSNFVSELSQKGLERAKNFSWEATVEKTIKALIQ